MSRPARPPVPIVVVVTGGCNHALHLCLTILTCGWWAPIWLLVAICEPRRVVVVVKRLVYAPVQSSEILIVLLMTVVWMLLLAVRFV